MLLKYGMRTVTFNKETDRNEVSWEHEIDIPDGTKGTSANVEIEVGGVLYWLREAKDDDLMGGGLEVMVHTMGSRHTVPISKSGNVYAFGMLRTFQDAIEGTVVRNGEGYPRKVLQRSDIDGPGVVMFHLETKDEAHERVLGRPPSKR